MHVVIAVAAFSLLVGLLIFEKKESATGVLLTKPFLSVLFVIVALTGPGSNPSFFGLVLAGLVLCVAGDVLLIFPAKQSFLAGLVSFLLGHVLYSIAFFTTASPGPPAWIATPLVLLVGTGVFVWLRPHLGTMLVPVIAYMAVITVMVVGAAALAGNAHLGLTGRIVLFCGAILFYVSDILVARNRFVIRQYGNRLVGLPLYYGGQFMIACSLRLL